MSVTISLLCGHPDAAIGCRFCEIDNIADRMEKLEAVANAAHNLFIRCKHIPHGWDEFRTAVRALTEGKKP